MYRKSLSFLALFLLLLTSCQLKEPVESITVPEAKNTSCTPETRWFDLNFWSIGQSAYWVNLETGPYVVKECMCNIQEFQLFVTDSSSPQWNLMLQGGQMVPFTPELLGSADLLRITDIGSIFAGIGDQGSGLLKSVASGNSPVANAVLLNAGGLCVIDNYDGNGTFHPVGSTATGPIVVVVPGLVPNTYIVKVYIPEEITDPV